jgi:hypothetical protein
VALTANERFALSEAGRTPRVMLGRLIKDSMQWFTDLSDAEARELLRKHPSLKLTQTARMILRAFLRQNQCLLRPEPAKGLELAFAYQHELEKNGGGGDGGKRNNEDALRITLTREEEAQLRKLARFFGLQSSVLARLAIMRFAESAPWINEQIIAGNYNTNDAPKTDSHA